LKLCIVVNRMGSRTQVGRTTYRLALRAARGGHEVWLTSAGGLSYEADGSLLARAIRARPRRDMDLGLFQQALAEAARSPEWVGLDDADVLLLRNNPSVQSPWAKQAALQFGRLLAERGVLVLNDPEGLDRAANKAFLSSFPADIRPRTVVTRRLGRARAFARELGRVVIKPVQGSGGRNVFLLEHGSPSFDACFRAVVRDGFAVVQEYLEAARQGNTRVFLVNGELLTRSGRAAVVRRVPTGDDPRGNVHAGAEIRRARIDPGIARVVAGSRERLVACGLFFVGLDVVGDKLIEANVFCPGGLGSAQAFEKVDFTAELLSCIERKLELRAADPTLTNAELATLG
jgi:glutathione synthase